MRKFNSEILQVGFNAACFIPISFCLALVMFASGSCAIADPIDAKLQSNPIRKSVVPSELDVLIYNHIVPGAKKSPAWSYVTSGLKKFGQAEIIITILKRPGDSDENYPEDPIKFLKMLPGLAKKNLLVTNGGRTELGGPQEFIAPQFAGLIYTKPELFPSVSIPRGSIAGVPVTHDELEVYKLSGPSRVLARLAHLAAFYPFPTWCDRDRKSVFTQSDVTAIKASPLSRGMMGVLVDGSATSSEGTIHFAVGDRAKEKLVQFTQKLPEGAPLTLSLGVDPRANAFLVWTPGAATAVAPGSSNGSRLGGSFLEIVPAAKKNEAMQAEDGFIVFITSKDWAELKAAVAAGKNYVLGFDSDKLKSLSVEMPQSIEQHSRTAVGIWHSYDPSKHKQSGTPAAHPLAKGKQSSTDAAKVVLLILMTPDTELREYIDVEPLAKYAKDLEKVACDYFNSEPFSPKSFDLVIRSTIKPKNEAEYKISWSPEGLDDTRMGELLKKLKETKVPDADGDVSIELLMDLWKPHEK